MSGKKDLYFSKRFRLNWAVMIKYCLHQHECVYDRVFERNWCIRPGVLGIADGGCRYGIMNWTFRPSVRLEEGALRVVDWNVLIYV